MASSSIPPVLLVHLTSHFSNGPFIPILCSIRQLLRFPWSHAKPSFPRSRSVHQKVSLFLFCVCFNLWNWVCLIVYTCVFSFWLVCSFDFVWEGLVPGGNVAEVIVRLLSENVFVPLVQFCCYTCENFQRLYTGSSTE